MSTHQEAVELLRRLTGRPEAQFHEGQFEAVSALVDDRRRALVVQRTGWGKSAVYFVATALLRQRGAGPTVLISPLLALMRDQVAAAERAGVRAAAINSATVDEWESISAQLAADEIDVLLVSPERLNNPQFREHQLPGLLARMACSSSTRRTASPTGATTSGPTTAGSPRCWTSSIATSPSSPRPRPPTPASSPTSPISSVTTS